MLRKYGAKGLLLMLRTVVSGMALAALMAGGATAQSTLSFTIDDSDLAYLQNPGSTYEIVTVQITDPANFRVNASNIVTTGNAPGGVGYTLFPVGVPVPQVFRWQDHRDDPLTVAGRNEGNAQNNNGVPLPDRANGPLTAGQFQLVVTPRDGTGNRGDFTLDVTLTGGTFVLLAPPPVGGGGGAFAGTTAGASRLLLIDVHGVTRDQGQSSLVARDAALSFIRTTGDDGAPLVTMSTQSSPGFAGDIYTWVEATGYYASDDTTDRNLRGYGLQIGADLTFGPGLVGGLSLGASDITGNNAGTVIEGDLIYVQPYISYREGALALNGSVLYGQGDFDQSGLGGDGTGETELWAATLDAGYDFALEPGLTVTPMIGLVYGVEETTGTSGAVTGVNEVTFSQASFGARLTHSFSGGEVYGGLHVDYNTSDSDTVLTSDLLYNDGATARVEVGGSWALDNGLGLDTSFEIGGVGGDVTETSAAIRFTLRF